MAQSTLKQPPANVLGPGIEALRYAGPHQELREMFAELVASAMDPAKSDHAHPAFVEMIKEMMPDEAKIMRLFLRKAAFPVVDVISANPADPDKIYVVLANISRLAEIANCDVPARATMWTTLLGSSYCR